MTHTRPVSRRPITALLAMAVMVVTMTLGAGAAAAASVPPAPTLAPSCQPYPDVDASNSACQNIAWLKTMGITKPADGLYHPLNGVTRGAMAAFLFRLMHPGKASPGCTSRPFPDVPVDSTFCGYVTWARNQHIAYGYSNGDYGPGNIVTRGAMAAYLYRMAESKTAPKCTSKPFSDVPVGSTFCAVITWMKTTGITYGVGGGKYGTTLPVTRQAMASFLHRAVDLGYLGIPAPLLKLTVVDDEVTAGTAPRFSYTAINVPTPAKVALQMMDESAATPSWHTVATFPTGTHTRKGPTVSGWETRDYRLVVTDYGTTLGTSATVEIGVYGKVLLTTLCASSTHVYATCPATGTIPVGDGTFSYHGGVVPAGSFDTSQWTEFMSVYLARCRSITLRFATDSTFTDTYNHQELHVWTGSGDSYDATTYVGHIGSLTAPLGADTVNFEVRSDTYGSVKQDIYVDGWASCDTPDGAWIIT